VGEPLVLYQRAGGFVEIACAPGDGATIIGMASANAAGNTVANRARRRVTEDDWERITLCNRRAALLP
jgi:hypothetical protein